MSIAEHPQHFDSPRPPEAENRPNIGFGIYLPETVLTNQEIELWEVLTPNGNILTAENIQKRTGISKRYVANEDETPFLMGLRASREALRQTKDKIGFVIVSTSFPTGTSLSSQLKEELGISGVNLDVHAACSGFTLSLAHIKKHEEEFLGKSILLVATEKYSPHLHDLRGEGSKKDPSLAQTIFSDGAIAMIFEYGRDLQVLSAINHKFPSDSDDSIKMPVNKKLLTPCSIDVPVPYPESGKFEQDGAKVFKLICRNVPQLIKNAIEAANLDPSQRVKMIIPHQGSGHMVEGIGEKLDEYLVYRDFEDGNFSSASIPKALRSAIKKGEIKKGDIVVLAGFGAGLFASTVVVKFG